MISFDDDRWTTLRGGYRTLYDPRRALLKLERKLDIEDAWRELWQELYHQGDVGEASYACIPYLVGIYETFLTPDWNIYSLAGSIEIARQRHDNPSLPEWLGFAYSEAWVKLRAFGYKDLESATDQTLFQSIIGVLALGNNLKALGQIALEFNNDELEEMIATYSSQ